MVWKRLLTILSPLIIAVGLELLFFINLDAWRVSILLAALFLVLFFSLKMLIAEKISSRNFWSLAVLPLFFYLLTANYILILSNGYFRHIVVILFLITLYFYLENLFLFYFQRAYYQINSLENAGLFLNILLFFLLAVDLNALSVLLNPPLWLLSLCLIVILFIILSQLFWILKINDKLKYAYILILTLLMLEFFWALSFLPSNFYALAIILTIIYYFSFGIIRSKLANELSRQILIRYLTISLILILIIIFSSHWI